MDPRLQQYLSEQQIEAQTVVPLTGDASDRRYFRVLVKDSTPIVLALHAGPIEYAKMPFVAVARLFAEVPLPVPRILHHSDPLGILGLEDLGDVTLQAHLGVAEASEHAALYRQAVGFIATLQERGYELESEEYPPYRVAFDVEKLTWELEFFVRHYLQAYKGASPAAGEREALREEWSSIVEELAGEPRVLCHRDYHSRNLMLHRGSLYIIDFQDARMGPDTYDLASLLRDSYVDLKPPQVDGLIAYFLAHKSVTAAAAQEFRRRFDLMALQRNLRRWARSGT
jgi:aminoglycoside/choline kinase family phosphotransferase